MCDFDLIFVAVRKPSLTSNPPQIVHPPHLYTNTAATVIHHYPGQVGHPGGHHHALPASASSETATYVNINRPAFPPNNLMHNHHTQHRPPVIHPGSAGHVPYSPAFHHHQHVRPVGIAMPRQGESFQRQSSVGNVWKNCILMFKILIRISYHKVFFWFFRTDWYWYHSATIS